MSVESTPVPNAAFDTLCDEAGLTDDERAALFAHLSVQRMDDLLSPEEREQMYRDLFAMAQERRRVEAESRNIALP